MKFLDLFAGIGGFRLGMEATGHECVGFCEIDKFARASYKAIHNTEGEHEYHDITTVTDKEWAKFKGEIDVITGGFPCQAFSVAGNRLGFEDTRGTLFFEIARAAKQIQPRLLLLENVKGLLSHDKGRTFESILFTLDELGYDAEWQVLNSKNFGVPQNRERVFIIGHLRGECGREIFPLEATDTKAHVQAIGNINPSGKGMNGNVYASDGLSPTLTTNKGEGLKILNPLKGKTKNGWHFEQNVYDPEGLTRTVKAGGGSGNIPKIIGNIYNNSHNSQAGRIFDTDGISPTLDTCNGGNRMPKIAIPVLTPDRSEKRQNGRRFKENGEPMFTLTGQDRHGVVVGGLYTNDSQNHHRGVLNGLSRTLKANKSDAGVLIKNNSPHKPCLEANNGDNISLQPKARGSVRSGYSGTVATQPDAVLQDMRVRKLTPRECWRLQGFPDSTFEKAEAVNSNSQLYKQAGNSVTVPVIYEIAKKL
ncbi:MAG: DNA cytosine methyltransferase [Streptococcaceae bacterium]|nr:DNA cytosine methyltransferase [Streptococcaceae bacterium]MCL2680887.1 DNA cytosine methyltransferase [Streptococcaceae bacterium]MCL2858083.1 DNA cytosine methyltransferase [Streptococcaceae bacterium]